MDLQKTSATEFKLIPTTVPHVYRFDVKDDGNVKNIFLFKQFEDGSICYMVLDGMSAYETRRLMGILSTFKKADKFEGYEILEQKTLGNGLNALDFFFTNFKQTKFPYGVAQRNFSMDDFLDKASKIQNSASKKQTPADEYDPNSLL